MAKVSAAQYAEKWARRTAAATQDYEAGVKRVQTAPGQAAAAQKSVYVQNVQQQANKWADRVQAVSLTDWQNAAVNKGRDRIAAGVQAALPKVQQTANNLLAAVDAAAAAAKAMPKGTLEQNIARSAEFQRRMAQAKIK